MKKTNTKNQITDEMLVRFFDAKESGKSFPDSLIAMGEDPVFGEDLEELRALWDLHGSLVRTAHNTSPDRALLSRTLSELSAETASGVTSSNVGGYGGESAQGEVNHINHYLNLFMNFNWKIVAPVAVILVVVVAATQTGGPAPTKLSQNTPPEATTMALDSSEGEPAAKLMAMTSPTPVSGNVDDLIASLSVEADGDIAFFADATADIALVGADSQAITDLNSAYDETTF